MKRAAVLCLAAICFGLLAIPRALAAGPDDLYLDAYRMIQEGDQFTAANQPDIARQRYSDAETNLKKLQGSYPNYSKGAVEFRLEYLHGKLKALPAPREQAAPPSAPPESKPPIPANPQDQIKPLTDQIAQLQSENATLQAKLKEALAAQPAAVDPREFAKAQDRITQLEKEKELLRVGLEQAQAKQPQAADLAMFDQTKKELEGTKKQLVEAVANVASLTQENQKLKQDLASAQKSTGLESALKEARENVSKLEQERAEWQKQRAELETKVASANSGGSDNSKIKTLEKERDSLLKKLNDANKELYDVKARGQAAQFETLTNQLANLRARLEVFEARKAPFTKEELALMNKDVPKLNAAVDSKPSKRASKDLPAGAGILIADADAAFAAHRYADAEQKYQQLVKMDEDNPVTLENLAAIQLQMQKLDAADANVTKALAARPDDAYALCLRGMVRFQQGKYDEALDALTRSAQIDPKNPETENYLG
ncbi:MAG TPA: tetratricopeptide repeat protein, partial [Verrucomicrobiae bacterium]|nr:tetratricopeptide repeat protein [Verrucomicrobiae bacterium]